jgi:hypothetical protein
MSSKEMVRINKYRDDRDRLVNKDVYKKIDNWLKEKDIEHQKKLEEFEKTLFDKNVNVN